MSKNGYNGYLFQKGNVSDLEKKIMKVYNLKKFQLNKIQNNARLRVISHFDEQVVIQKTLNFIKKSI